MKYTKTGTTAGIGLLLLLLTNNGAADKIAKDESLVPEGEKALMSEHAANLDSIAYRPGKGIQIKSEDGKFSLVTRLRLQTLATVANRSKEPAEMGIILRRARLQFIGNMYGKHNKFKSELAFSPRDLRMKQIDSDVVLRETPLLTWYMEFDHLRDLTVRVGQYKIPYSRQRVISSGNQQMVDRSLANGEFNLDRDIGFDIRSKDFMGLGMFKYYAGVYNGEGRSQFTNGNSDLMFMGRVEFLPLGMFSDYSEGDLERLAKPGVSIGVAYASARNARGSKVNRDRAPEDGGTTDFQSMTADISFKFKGLALSSEFHWREGERNVGDAVDDMGMAIPEQAARNGIGWFVQAGYLVPKMPIELTGRYGQTRAKDDSSIGDSNEAGMALSYYFAQHPFKLQADGFQLWDEGFGDGRTRVRVQMQLAF